jgi:hypothetical protein
LDVLGLGALRSVRYFKLNFLTLDQGLVAITGYRAVMHKNILLAALLDKSVAFRVIEPLDQTNSLRHFLFSSNKLQNRKINSDHQSLLAKRPDQDAGIYARAFDQDAPTRDKQKILQCKINGVYFCIV